MVKVSPGDIVVELGIMLTNVGVGSSSTTAVQVVLSLAVGSFCEVAMMVISSSVSGTASSGMVRLMMIFSDSVEAIAEVADGAVSVHP